MCRNCNVNKATLPTQTDELLAIIVSESTAGFTGGLASRVVAALVGDRKRDGSLLEGTTTGTYFGVRAAAKSAALAVGFSLPLATVIADIAASAASESAKAIGRKSAEDQNSSTSSSIIPTSTSTSTSTIEASPDSQRFCLLNLF